MLPERWQKLGEVFDVAVDLPDEQQKAYLDEACGDDAELRHELDQMLGLDAEVGSSLPHMLQAAIGAVAANYSESPDSDPLLGSFLGPYRVVSLIGRGGMGSVYRATREDDQFRKEVAIKVIPRVLAGSDAVSRFRAERQILANLEHPNIARLLDGGTSEGIPYLVMEYIEGLPITKYVTDHNLPVIERLQLMRSVCEAIQYAHRNLIVHRDLKPANILVSNEGVVKLLDFGVAKMMDPSLTEHTHTSAMMMTPDYASPEQIRGEPVTTTADVYSLGIVLYEVLTGERPYRLTGQTPLEMERVICNTEPRRPSDVEMISKRLRRSLTGDLDNIVLMALRKDPARRYQSAEHLSEDIRRHLEGKPVRARPDTAIYRSGKFLHRNRWAVLATLLVAASLVTGIVVSTRQARVARYRFDQFRGFARTVLIDLHSQLSDIPGTGRARQALIAHVGDYLKRVVADNAEDDTALASEIATTYLRLGELQGATPDAIVSFESGCALLEAKRLRRSASAEDLLVLARLRLRIGNTLVDLGKAAEGKESLLTAFTLANEVKASGGTQVEASKIKARAYWRVARIYRVQYKLSEAERYATVAVAACEELVKAGNQDRDLDEVYNGARLVLGGVLRRQGRWQESLDLYRAVLADNKRRAAQNPASAGLQRELARTHQILGDMLSRIPGHDIEVRNHVRGAIGIAESLLAPDPQDLNAQSELAQYLSSGAEALTQAEDLDEGEQYLRRALPIFISLLEREPDSGLFMLYAALTEAELGDRMGRAAATPESLQRVRSGWFRMLRLVEREPGDTTHIIELLKLQRMLARQLARAGKSDEALRLSEDLVQRARAVANSSGAQTELPMRELPRAYASMGQVFRHLGKAEESRKWYQMAVKEWESLRSRGTSLPDTDDEVEEAKRQFKL